MEDDLSEKGHARCVDVVSHPVVSLEEWLFAGLGRLLGKRPVGAALLSVFLYLVFVPGVFLLEGDGDVLGLPLDTDFLTTFTLTDSPEYSDYTHATGLFPGIRSVGLVETSLPGHNLLAAATFRSALGVEERILAEVRAKHQEREVGFQDVCARSAASGPCRYFSAASAFLGTGLSAEAALRELEAMEADGSHTASSRALWMVQRLSPVGRALLEVLVGTGSPGNFPGASAGDAQLASWLLTARSLTARLDVADSRVGAAFEVEAARFVNEVAEPAGLRVRSISSSSLGQECAKIGMSAVPLLAVAIVMMGCYVLIFLGAETRSGHDSQLLLVLIGTSIPGLSSLSTFGFMGYLGLKLNVLALMAPFLGLAVGVDAVFLVITSINTVPFEVQDPSEVMARALPRAGVAATTTTFTSVMAFVVSAATNTAFPGFFAFSLILVSILLLNWIGMLVLLPSCVVLNERRIVGQRLDLAPCLSRRQQVLPENVPKSDARPTVKPGCLVRLGCGRRCRRLIAQKYAPLVEFNLPCQLAGAALWLGLLIAGIALVPKLDKGMPDLYFVTDSSPLNQYFEDAEAAFGKVVGIDVNILLERPQLGSPAYRAALLNFTSLLQGRADAAGPPQCWPALVAAQLPPQAGDAQAAAVVAAFFASNQSNMAYAWDARLGTAGVVEAARCHFNAWQPTDAQERATQAEDLIGLTKGAGLSALAYEMSFPIQVVRYREILRTTLLNAGYACIVVLVTLLLMLPMHLAVLAVVNVVAVVMVLLGFMVATGITCNAISNTVVLMAIGFCVDYSCHVVHFADHGLGHDTPWQHRVGHSLRECGFDVMQGCATAFLGVALLGFNAAEAFRIFAAMALLITGMGGLYALWGLPSVLALLSRLRGGLAARRGAAEASTEGELEGKTVCWA